jgi:5-methyltetrahydropteroyltriglutamate--homocysteine methyltransferase
LPVEEQEQLVRESIKQAVEDQIELGIDILVDGQVRDDIVFLFASKFPGYQEQIFPYHVVGRIQPAEEPITVQDYLYAKELAGDRPVKAHLTGPMVMERVTAVGTDSDYAGKHDPQLVLDIAKALGQEARFLVEAGAEVVQIDELILAEGGIDLDLAFAAMRHIIEIGEIPFPALHACGNITKILDEILTKSPVKMVSIEGGWLAHDELRHINREYLSRCGKQIGLGCIGTSDYTIDKLPRVKQFLQEMVERLGEDQIWAAMPDCGLRPVSREMVQKKIEVMVQAARSV